MVTLSTIFKLLIWTGQLSPLKLMKSGPNQGRAGTSVMQYDPMAKALPDTKSAGTLPPVAGTDKLALLPPNFPISAPTGQSATRFAVDTTPGMPSGSEMPNGPRACPQLPVAVNCR